MTNETILKKVIKKATGNGWKKGILWLWENGKISEFDIIFSHDFAKAFFGEDPIEGLKIYIDSEGKYVQEYGVIPAYQFYLQQMVISEDTIKYLEKFI